MSQEEEREQFFINGPAGKIQIIIDRPPVPALGIVVISHPQPLLGGSPRHVVPLTLSRRLSMAGWIAVRPSFRGVDGTEGEYSGGMGETVDSAVVVRYLRRRFEGLPVAMVGFSFGAHVFARTVCDMEQEEAIEKVVLLGLPIGEVEGGRHYPAMPVPERTLLIHGERDDIAPFANVLDWARSEYRPVLLFSGANHFFKGCLDQVADRILEHLGH